MPSIPHFFNVTSALIAGAIAVPLLLLLYFLKLRRREQWIPSTFLWKKSIEDLQVNAPFQKLRRNLLLLLQLLLLLLLLLSLARPVSNYRPGAGKRTILLIDRSASMSARDGGGGHTRLQEAKRRARELVDSMGRQSSAMVIAFDDSAQAVQPWTTDAAALRTAIDAIEPTDRRTRLKLAYQLAEAQTNFNPNQNRASETDRPDVHLYSDGRVLDDTDDLSVRGNLVFEKIGSDDTANIGIVALNAKRNYERPSQVQIFARLANYGPEPIEAPVQLAVDGETVVLGGAQVRNTFLLPDRWTREQRDKYDAGGGKPAADSVDFRLDINSAAVVRLQQLKTDGDALSADDIAQVVVPAPKSLAVLLVTQGNYFLEKAILSLGLEKPVVMRPEAYEQKLQTQFDVIIFDRYSPKVLPPAGSFVYFLGAGTDLPGDLKMKVAHDAAGKPALLTDVGVLDWKRDHPILRGLALTKLYVAEGEKLDVPPQAEVLLDGLKGPLMVLLRQGKQTHLAVAFDVLQSNWPLKVSFPIFLDNALHYLAIGSDMDVRQSFAPGATPLIPRAALQKISQDLKSFKLNGPMGTERVNIPAVGDVALPAMNLVGLYSTDPAIPQYEQMAVNLLDSNESNLIPAAKAPGDANAPVDSLRSTRARFEWWWWLVACGAVPLLMIEWWVYTRRVHL